MSSRLPTGECCFQPCTNNTQELHHKCIICKRFIQYQHLQYRHHHLKSFRILRYPLLLLLHTSGMISGVSPPFLTYTKQIHILMDFLQHVLDIRGEGENDTPENGHGNHSSKVVGGGGCKNTISNGYCFHIVIEFCSSILLDPTLDRTSLSISYIGSWNTRSLLKQQHEQQPLIAGHVSKRNQSTNSTHQLVETYHTLDLIRFTRSILLYSSGTYPVGIHNPPSTIVLQYTSYEYPLHYLATLIQ